MQRQSREEKLSIAEAKGAGVGAKLSKEVLEVHKKSQCA